MTRAYEEIVEFIAGGSTPAEVAEWAPSEEAKARVRELIAAEKAGQISKEDLAELNHFMEIEHIMRLAKARARQAIGDE